MYKILDQYKMVVSHPHFCDTERFFNQMFRLRIKLEKINHVFYYPKDIIRNLFSLQEQETKKEKWRVYSRVLEFIHCFEKDYNPLDKVVVEEKKNNKPMIAFLGIMEEMNEKKNKNY